MLGQNGRLELLVSVGTLTPLLLRSTVSLKLPVLQLRETACDER
jgi:hypothetical protein